MLNPMDPIDNAQTSSKQLCQKSVLTLYLKKSSPEGELFFILTKKVNTYAALAAKYERTLPSQL